MQSIDERAEAEKEIDALPLPAYERQLNDVDLARVRKRLQILYTDPSSETQVETTPIVESAIPVDNKIAIVWLSIAVPISVLIKEDA